MKLFGQLVRTAVNVALLPVAVVADVATGGGVMSGHNDDASASGTFTGKRLRTLKDEAAEDADERPRETGR